MDHFYQLPVIGKPDEPMLEAYSALSALATATDTIQLSALVTGNTYRNPAILAKTVTTLDVVSGGRAILGIGAGWFELEHTSFGLEFVRDVWASPRTSLGAGVVWVPIAAGDIRRGPAC